MRLLPLLPLLLISVANAAPIEFNRDIRPILNARCFKCHGGVKEAGGLNLQFREKALLAGETGEIAIVPGKPHESAMIERLLSGDPTERMPKKETPLPKEQIELLQRWVEEGAHWEKHWAYEPPRGEGRTIDAIVGARLEHEGVAFSPEADLRTLARRLSLDLVGLPPSPARLEALEKAAAVDRETAIRGYVEELLAAPGYGERWAVPWLDLARYADSRGYEKDSLRDMWRYRDWLIESLNADMPYSRFVTAQLAGDLLPDAGDEELIPTAFHRNTPQNDEDGSDDEEFRTLAVIDRLNTTFEAIQGTSIGCVQCHGHPYDAFVHREYYQLLAFFNNTADADRRDQDPTRAVRARADVPLAARFEAQIAAAQTLLDGQKARPESKAAFEQWLAKIRGTRELKPLGAVQVAGSVGAWKTGPDGAVSLDLPEPDRATITVTGSAAGTFNAIELEALPDKKLPNNGPGTNVAGNFIVTEFRASILADGVETPLEFSGATASFEQPNWPVAEALRKGNGVLPGEGESGWAINGGAGRSQTALFTLKTPATLPEGAQLRVIIACENERWEKHVLGAFRLSTSLGAAPAIPENLPKELRGLVAREPGKWKPEERASMERHFFSGQAGDFAALYQTLDAARAGLAALPLCTLPVMRELEGSAARKTQVFHRGNWKDKAEEVSAATPQILNAWRPEYPRNRLGLAQWLTNGENPLTARVQVNRLWEQLFGVGLVETLEDFGSQGEKPVYRDLLDELAVRFSGPMQWSQKTLLREMVLSRVYRQSSKATKAQTERDPANRLLARGPRFRLGHEQVRDQALAVCGLLSAKMFGRPVMPFQPPGTWLTPYEGVDWKTSPDEDAHRRAVYTLIRRSAAYPSMLTFDAPNREFCVVRRLRTNTPLQSLDLLNSPVFMEAAAAFAKRMSQPGGPLEEQLARGIALATLRPAKPAEIAVLARLYERTGGSLTLVANAILNLDEVLTKN